MKRLAIVGLALSVALVATATATAAAAATVVPDHFLRRWDPVTIFFTKDRGPAAGAPEDDLAKIVTLAPEHPVVATWIDRRTLQIRPVEPWPPLARVPIGVDGATTTLATLTPPPQATVPSADATDLDPIEEITLTFPVPIEAEALAKMTAIELRPLPGVGSGQARWLGAGDFSVKTLERRSPGDPASYVLAFDPPIPLGLRVVVHLRLSLDDASSESFVEIPFATAEPFHVVSAGCDDDHFPISPDGSRFSRDQAIRCASGARAVVVELSAEPKELGPVEARNLVRLTPSPAGLEETTSGRTVRLAGDFDWDTLYHVELLPTAIEDSAGRRLELRHPSDLWLYFPRRPARARRRRRSRSPIASSRPRSSASRSTPWARRRCR